MTDAVLVTGGAGYIGSHVCKRLAEAGLLPVAYDNLSSGHEWAVRWGPLVQGELADPARLAWAFEQHRPIAAMHFAGLISVADSMRDPAAYYRNNVAAGLVLLEALRRHGTSGLVFSSTAALYGIPNRLPIPEEHAIAPINPYGASKAAFERMLADFSAAHGLRSVSLRYFNAAGADPSAEIGEAHDPEFHLIPLILDVALGRRGELLINGEDYDTADGTCVRDYIHVMDLADAHIAALGYLRAGGATTALNLGTSKGHSVRAVLEAARAVTGHPIPARIADRRAGDPAILVADARAASRLLDWRPRLSAIERQIEDAWRWHRRHFAA
jgi:UDP-arabinose 4-epimerase